jgi:hypothetical protein
MPRLLRTVGRTAVIAGTATAVSNRVSRRQGRRWSEQQAYEQQQQAPAAPPPQQVAPPPAAPSEGDKFAELEKLGKLHEQGILTDAEFAAEKAKILG